MKKEKPNYKNNSAADDERCPYIMSVYHKQQLRIIKLTKPSIIAFEYEWNGIRYKYKEHGWRSDKNENKNTIFALVASWFPSELQNLHKIKEWNLRISLIILMDVV